MKKLFYLLSVLIIASLLLTACGPGASAPAQKVQVRWFVGLGTGTDPAQQAAQEKAVKDFNASQNEIELVLEVVPYESAKDTLATQIASGNGPDIIGPVGWGGSNAFYGQWLDMTPYLKDFDLSVFDPALVKFYQTEEGQVACPSLFSRRLCTTSPPCLMRLDWLTRPPSMATSTLWMAKKWNGTGRPSLKLPSA